MTGRTRSRAQVCVGSLLKVRASSSRLLGRGWVSGVRSPGFWSWHPHLGKSLSFPMSRCFHLCSGVRFHDTVTELSVRALCRSPRPTQAGVTSAHGDSVLPAPALTSAQRGAASEGIGGPCPPRPLPWDSCSSPGKSHAACGFGVAVSLLLVTCSNRVNLKRAACEQPSLLLTGRKTVLNSPGTYTWSRHEANTGLEGQKNLLLFPPLVGRVTVGSYRTSLGLIFLVSEVEVIGGIMRE